MSTGTFDDGQYRWEQDLQALNLSYLTLLRAALRDDFQRACAAFGLKKIRFAQRLESMDQGQLLRLSKAMGSNNFIRFDETMAMEVLVDRVLEGATEEEIRISVMAHVATDRGRADHIGA